MARHWKPPPRKPVRFTAGELRLALLGGLLLGLVVAQAGDSGWLNIGKQEATLFGAPPETGLPAVSERAAIGSASQQVDSGDFVDVIDGDTFRVGDTKIRIADIDTPEVDGPCAAERVLAAEATERLAALLAQGPFTLEAADRDEDRYGRKLRVVIRGGRSIGDQLVDEGLARRWSGRREPWCA
jgi:endonuclease YncB( thermonuclease family)